MHFIKINYHFNQRFFVEDNAFQEMIEKVFESMKEIKLLNSDVKLEQKENLFNVSLEIEVEKNKNYSDIAKKIQSEIEEKSLLLIDGKPKNIEIIFSEKYKNRGDHE